MGMTENVTLYFALKRFGGCKRDNSCKTLIYDILESHDQSIFSIL